MFYYIIYNVKFLNILFVDIQKILKCSLQHGTWKTLIQMQLVAIASFHQHLSCLIHTKSMLHWIDDFSLHLL
jgi:hypothetical protein